MVAIDSGSKIWDAISNKPVDELDLRPETKALLKESLFVHPLPFVETVIFISTPHGGSYQASQTVVGLFRRLVTLPVTIANVTADIVTNAGNALKLAEDRRPSTASPACRLGTLALRRLGPFRLRPASTPTPSFRHCRMAHWRAATTASCNTRVPIYPASSLRW